ncbi:MAG: DUF1573 domain-containing protein [Planctomycetia bacterium]|nr:DUF1573 domain-containing protein [Planctomycetia bacterium]
MRIFSFVVISLVVGVVIGGVWGLWDSNSLFARSELTASSDANMPRPVPAGSPQPRLELDHVNHDFGRMEYGATGKHTFLFTNTGEGPLRLAKGETSCKCTLSKLAQKDIPPGKSGEVTLEWTAKSPDPLFRHTATVLTNDPKHPRVTLTIEGVVSQSTSIVPPEIVFTNLTRDEQGSAKTHIYTEARDDMAVTGHAFENAELASFFDASYHQLPPEALPEGQKSGWEVVVSVKPGLPAGDIEQKIRLQTNLPDVPDLVVPIQGRVGSPILIVGPGSEWNQDQFALRMGTFTSDKGAKRELKLMIRGPRRKDVKLSNVRTDPALLQATLGEPKDLGSVIEVPLSIVIPPGAPTVNYLGYQQGRVGHITIDTNQEEIGQVRLKVAFAVAGE